MMKRLFGCCLALIVLSCTASNCGGGIEPEPGPVTPDTPAGVMLHGATQQTLTFQWSPVSGAASYEWKLLQGGSQVQEGSVSSRNVTISGLEAGTMYQFSVRAVSGSAVSAWSAALAAQTEAEK